MKAPTAAAIAANTINPAPAPHTFGDFTAVLVMALKFAAADRGGGAAVVTAAGDATEVGAAALAAIPLDADPPATVVTPEGTTTVAASGLTSNGTATGTCR